MTNEIGRRAALGGMAGAAALSLGARCALAQAAAKEAPDLARQAAAGGLPPLAERLPADPLVVTPHERVGAYGGTLRRGLRGSADHNGILRMVGNQGLVRWNLAFTEVLPNVAARWEVNANATEFTFHLRQGMKWSRRQALHGRRRRLLHRGLLREHRALQVRPSVLRRSAASRRW